jgi:hypothetical protein
MRSITLDPLLVTPLVAHEPASTGHQEEVTISSQHLTRRPINAIQQGQFMEILCNLIPSIIAQEVVSTSFEDAPPCHVAYKGEVDEPHRPLQRRADVHALWEYVRPTGFRNNRPRRVHAAERHVQAERRMPARSVPSVLLGCQPCRRINGIPVLS